MAKVLALVERDAREGTAQRSASALLTLARRLGDPVAVVGGAPPDPEMIRTLAHYGATEIWCAAEGAAGALLPNPREEPAAGEVGSPAHERAGGRGGSPPEAVAAAGQVGSTAQERADGRGGSQSETVAAALVDSAAHELVGGPDGSLPEAVMAAGQLGSATHGLVGGPDGSLPEAVMAAGQLGSAAHELVGGPDGSLPEVAATAGLLGSAAHQVLDGQALALAGSMAEPLFKLADLVSAGAAPDSSAAALPATDTDLLAALAHRLAPAAILIAGTARGQETAARLAIRLDSGIITDAVDVLPGPDGGPVALQHCLAGSYLVESSVIRGVPIITVRPEAAVPEPHPGEPVLRTIAVEPSVTRAPLVSATPKPRASHPALDHADIVVAGGRGVGSRAAFAVLAEVADALGGAVAGSHTAAELGWVPPEARVGLTGKTVHPQLYLACGVSGSVRHRAGMQGAKTVVAIGDDPNAPIFKLADLGIVGDAPAILPALLAEIRKRKR